MLQDISPYLRRPAKGESLSSEEVRRVLNELSLHDTEGYYFLALTFGIMAKGPMLEELKGFCLHYSDVCPKLEPRIDYSKTTNISGTGGDVIKTFNVGTTTSFVLAGAGAIVGKQAFKSWTSVSGSSEIFERLGVHVPLENGDPKTVERSLESVGMGSNPSSPP